MKAPHYPQLLENIRTHGQIFPIYLFEGAIIDGSQRQIAALEAGLEPKFQTLPDRETAARVLWTLHPERAVVMFAGTLTFRQQISLFGALPSSLYQIHKRVFPAAEKKKKKWPRNYSTGKQTVTLPPALKRRLVSLCDTYQSTQQDVIIAALELTEDEQLAQRLVYMRLTGRATKHGRKKAAVT